MSFISKKHPGGTGIHTVTLGAGARSCTIGGQNVLPFHSFDAPVPNCPKLGAELSDRQAQWTSPGIRAFYDGCSSMADCARRAQSLECVDFLALHFESADPAAENRSVEACAADAVSVAECTELPLVIMGCHHAEKDAALFRAVTEALPGRNLLLLSAREENDQAVAACSAGQTVGAETADDINLAKQLNITLTAAGVPADRIVMNIGTAAVGYGFEYVASTLDRVRLAALDQADEDLSMPIIAPVSPDSWSVKESVASEEEEPSWGDREERAIDMEISTAAACLAGGADAVILRHPASLRTIRQMIGALCAPDEEGI